MNATRCPVPGCTFEVPWNIPDAPPVSPYITDRAAAVREASRAVAAVEGDRIGTAILAHGEAAHDTATFVEAVLAQQNGP